MLADDVTNWVTPSTLAGGGCAALIAFAIIFIRFMTSSQTAFFVALSETRKSCDEAQVRMAQRFGEDAKEMNRTGEDAVMAVARMEKAMDALVNEVRAQRTRPA